MAENPGRTNTFYCFPTFQRASVGREPRLRPPVGLQDPSLPPEIHVWAQLLLAAAAGRASAGGSRRVEITSLELNLAILATADDVRILNSEMKNE